jgi:hypothetical protein
MLMDVWVLELCTESRIASRIVVILAISRLQLLDEVVAALAGHDDLRRRRSAVGGDHDGLARSVERSKDRSARGVMRSPLWDDQELRSLGGIKVLYVDSRRLGVRVNAPKHCMHSSCDFLLVENERNIGRNRQTGEGRKRHCFTRGVVGHYVGRHFGNKLQLPS